MFISIIRLLTYMSLWMLPSPVPFFFPRRCFVVSPERNGLDISPNELFWSGEWWYWLELLTNWYLSAAVILWHLFFGWNPIWRKAFYMPATITIFFIWNLISSSQIFSKITGLLYKHSSRIGLDFFIFVDAT